MARTGWIGFGLALLLALAACGGDEGQVTGDRDTAGVDAAGDDGAPAEANGPDAPPSETDGPDADQPDWGDFDTCTYTGRVTDPAGQPLTGLPVVICSETSPFCGSDKSDETGTWRVSGLERTALGAKVLGALAAHSSLTLPLAACTQPDTDLGTIVVYPLPAGEVVAAAAGGPAQVHPDLHLDLPAGLEFPNYDESSAMQAAAVDVAALHPSLAAQITPVAAFAIAPYGTKAPGPVPFQARLPLTGGEVDVYVLDHLLGTFLPQFSVSVGADGMAAAPAGQGLAELTWVAFVAR